MRKLIIGARGSKLSLAYVAKVKRLILENNSALKENSILIKNIKTSGDIFYDQKLSEIGGKGLFCREIEENLLDKKIDIAVHSLKDMESHENNDLIVGAFIERNDPRDVLISNSFENIEDLKKGTVIGSSSRRRELKLKLINQNITISNIRGNIDTRIQKIQDGKIDAIILAAAGIKSLNLENKIKKFFTFEEMLPAVGQGVIAVQCRKNDNEVKSILKNINHEKTSFCAIAERQLLKEINGDCDTAIGGLAIIENNLIKLKAQLFSDDGKESFNYEIIGNKSDHLKIGINMGKKILQLAGDKFIK